MSEAKTARLYVGAAATAAIAARASSEDRAALEAYARAFAVAFQDRDDLLGSGVVASRIGGSSEGDIRQGKRTRLYVLARRTLRGADRTAFLRAYGRGAKTTKRDVAVVRDLLRTHVLRAMEERIRESQKEARDALARLPARDLEAKQFLEALIEVQGSRRT
jgi:geranylgeranyl pyrophosphate synthase